MAHDGGETHAVIRAPDHTRCLPLELLAIVVTLVYSNCEYLEQKLILGAVCSRWRQLVWSLPHLWTNFTAQPRGDGKAVVHLLKLHAKNADNHPLSISLRIDHEDPRYYGDDEDYQGSEGYGDDEDKECAEDDKSHEVSEVSGTNEVNEIGEVNEDNEVSEQSWLTNSPLCHLIFNEYSSRTRSLKLYDIDEPTWEVINNHSRHASFSLLESLELSFDCGSYTVQLLWRCSQFPELRELSISGASFTDTTIPLGQLTSLTLDAVSPEFAICILSHCSSLITFSASDHWLGSPNPIPRPPLASTHDTVLPHLQTFVWDFRRDTAMICHVRLPAIRYLKWNQRDVTVWNPWEQLFKNANTLESVDLYVGFYHPIIRLLEASSAQLIRQVKITIETFEQLQDCLKYLTRDHAHNVSHFPNLRTLEIDLRDRIEDGQMLSFLRAVITMLQSRHRTMLLHDLAAIHCFHISVRQYSRSAPMLLPLKKEACILRELNAGGVEFSGELMDLIVAIENTVELRRSARLACK